MTIIAGPPSTTSPTLTLDVWMAAHGPLSPSAALVAALTLCTRASQLDDAQLRTSIRSLRTQDIVRDAHGEWIWKPAAVGSAVTHAVSDAQILERIGAILFHTLTGSASGYPLPDEHQVRIALRCVRPEIPSAVSDLVVRLVSSPGDARLTLAAVARDVCRLLGSNAEPRPPRSRLARTAGFTLALFLVFGIWWSVTTGHSPSPGTHDLTEPETNVLDVVTEEAVSLALIKEHTAAILYFGLLRNFWAARVPPEDPRIAWTVTHEAWVRNLRGDRLTTEQDLTTTVPWLARELGDSHPYTRAARLQLAATFEARGSAAQTQALRTQSDRTTRELLRGTSRVSDVSSSIPTAPGVAAHVNPNAPEREGFRQGAGGFFTPITSSLRRLAADHGWRLHVIADGPCRASVVVGDSPRLVTVQGWRAPDKRWRLRIEGVNPPLTVDAGTDESLAVSLIGHRRGELQVRVRDDTFSRTVDDRLPAPSPPHSLTFSEARACAVVWFEVPFPF